MGGVLIAPGVLLWRERFSPLEQKSLLDAVLAGLEEAPLYRPVMPNTGRPFSNGRAITLFVKRFMPLRVFPA